EALPMLRYRTGDLSSIDLAPCACGRTTARMARIRGRIDDMLIIRGVNLYPSEVERVLLGVADVSPHYQLVVERPGAMDELTVLCESPSKVDSDGLGQSVERALREAAGLSILGRVLDDGRVPGRGGQTVGRAACVADLAVVLPEARHARLDQRRALTRPSRVHRFAHDAKDLQRVRSVDADANDRVANRPIGHAAHRRLLFEWHRDRDAVVL